MNKSTNITNYTVNHYKTRPQPIDTRKCRRQSKEPTHYSLRADPILHMLPKLHGDNNFFSLSRQQAYTIKSMTEDITKIPKRDGKDIAHTVVKAGLSAIPFVGGPASELLSFVVAPSLDKRRNEWLESIARKLKDLEDKIENFSIKDLQGNESFISTVMQASRVAIANHHKVKRQALQNAVLTAALPNAIADDLQLMFLNWIDYFTPRHLEMLKLFQDFEPRTLPTKTGTTELFFFNEEETRKLSAQQVFPDLASNENLYNQIFADLHTRGLIKPNQIGVDGFFDKVKYPVHIPRLGQQFLDFITSPID